MVSIIVQPWPTSAYYLHLIKLYCCILYIHMLVPYVALCLRQICLRNFRMCYKNAMFYVQISAIIRTSFCTCAAQSIQLTTIIMNPCE